VSNDAFDLAWGLTKQNALSRFRTARDAERLRLQNQGARSRQRYAEMARQQRPPRPQPEPEPVEGPTGPPPTQVDPNYGFKEGGHEFFGQFGYRPPPGQKPDMTSLDNILGVPAIREQQNQEVTSTPPSPFWPNTAPLTPKQGKLLTPSNAVREVAPKAIKPAESQEKVTTDPKIEEAAKVIAEPEPETQEEVTEDPKIEEAAKVIAEPKLKPRKKTTPTAAKTPELKTPSKKEESKERPKEGYGSKDQDYNPRTGNLWGKGSKKYRERMDSYKRMNSPYAQDDSDVKGSFDDPKIKEAAKQIPKKKEEGGKDEKDKKAEEARRMFRNVQNEKAKRKGTELPFEEEEPVNEADRTFRDIQTAKRKRKGLPKDVDVKPIEPVEEAKPPLLESEGKPVEPESAKFPKGQDSFKGQEPIAAALAQTEGKGKKKATKPNLKSPPKEDKEKKKLPNLFPTSKNVKSNFNNVINMALDDNDAEAARHIFNSLDPDLAAELGMDEDQASEIRDAMRDIYRS
jgi:hypothetical protein